ncbi:unnamed protein product [Camellia sinensis]
MQSVILWKLTWAWRWKVMVVPAYLQLDLDADLVLPPTPTGRVDNQIIAKTLDPTAMLSGVLRLFEFSKTNGFEKSFLSVFPALMSLGSFVQLFPSLVDLPISVILWKMTWAWR